MKKLTKLSSPPTYIDRYINIRDSKHNHTKDILTSKHADIAAQYNNYENAITANNLHTLTTSINCNDIKDELRVCYDIPTIALRDLKKAIKSAQPKRLLKYCPMCGTTLPTTFDHYLPASKFPEYSVFVANLVPCCSLCNSTKDNDWLSTQSTRQYFYAFIDDIPDEDFLIVNLHQSNDIDGVGAIFSLIRPNGLSNSQWGLLEAHFKNLKLVERYNELSNEEVAEILSDCKIYVEESGKNAKNFLTRKAKSLKGIHGRNYWRAVLMSHLVAHPMFDDWVEEA